MLQPSQIFFGSVCAAAPWAFQAHARAMQQSRPGRGKYIGSSPSLEVLMGASSVNGGFSWIFHCHVWLLIQPSSNLVCFQDFICAIFTWEWRTVVCPAFIISTAAYHHRPRHIAITICVVSFLNNVITIIISIVLLINLICHNLITTTLNTVMFSLSRLLIYCNIQSFIRSHHFPGFLLQKTHCKKQST